MGQIIFQFHDSNGTVISQFIATKNVIIPVLCVFLALTVLFYVLRGVGLMTLAKRQGLKNGWLVWIPFCWVYIAGKLTGAINIFGKKFERFYIFAFVVVLVNGIISLVGNGLIYIPLADWVLKGNEVIVKSTSTIIYPTADMFPQGVLLASKILGYIQNVSSILEIVVLISIFFGFFKKYWIARQGMAGILSVFGLFPIFAFVVRKNDPIDYDQWMKARYQAFFNANQNAYGNPFGTPNAQNGAQGNQDQKSPFDEYEDKKVDGDPFSEFSSDKKDGE